MNRREHWDSIYRSKSETQLSWYQPHAERSLRFIRDTGVENDARVVDVGGGASTLVDDLLDAEFSNVSVLDVSEVAIQAAQSRLGPRARRVTWILADIISAALPGAWYDVWHDRAVFHFLTSESDRALYVQKLKASLKPDGHVVIATFGLAGPQECSGLEVVRYSPESLQLELGIDEFELAAAEEEIHRTPLGMSQCYIYCRFRRHQA